MSFVATADQKSKIINILAGHDTSVNSWIVKPHPTKPGFTVQKVIYQENGIPRYSFPDEIEQFGDSYHAQSRADYLNANEKYYAINAIIDGFIQDHFNGKQSVSIHSLSVNDVVPNMEIGLFDSVRKVMLYGHVSSVERFTDKTYIRVRVHDVDENGNTVSRIARFTHKDDTEVMVFNPNYEKKSTDQKTA